MSYYYSNYTCMFILIIALLIGIYCCWCNLGNSNISNAWLAMNIIVVIFLTLLLIVSLYCIISGDLL